MDHLRLMSLRRSNEGLDDVSAVVHAPPGARMAKGLKRHSVYIVGDETSFRP
jgi:hypothetical protein